MSNHTQILPNKSKENRTSTDGAGGKGGGAFLVDHVIMARTCYVINFSLSLDDKTVNVSHKLYFHHNNTQFDFHGDVIKTKFVLFILIFEINALKVIFLFQRNLDISYSAL